MYHYPGLCIRVNRAPAYMASSLQFPSIEMKSSSAIPRLDVQHTIRKGREMANVDKTQASSTQMQNIGTQVKETVQDVGTYVKETAQNIGTQVREKVQDMGTQAKETVQAAGTQVYAQGRESLQDLSRTLEGQIRMRPLQALLVAGGIGVLLGLLWRRS
jgi:ElaB/YqjD/DUF883 family membrane-anchored ribosome-binding protein